MILCVFYYYVLSCVADVRTIADCVLQRSVCNCNKDIYSIIIIIIIKSGFADECVLHYSDVRNGAVVRLHTSNGYKRLMSEHFKLACDDFLFTLRCCLQVWLCMALFW